MCKLSFIGIFREVGGSFKKNPFCEGGTCIDILRSYTLSSHFREFLGTAGSQKQRVVNPLHFLF